MITFHDTDYYDPDEYREPETPSVEPMDAATLALGIIFIGLIVVAVFFGHSVLLGFHLIRN